MKSVYDDDEWGLRSCSEDLLSPPKGEGPDPSPEDGQCWDQCEPAGGGPVPSFAAGILPAFPEGSKYPRGGSDGPQGGLQQ